MTYVDKIEEMKKRDEKERGEMRSERVSIRVIREVGKREKEEGRRNRKEHDS